MVSICSFYYVSKKIINASMFNNTFILTDLRRLNSMAVKAINTGMIIVGGGVVKHHICNANLMVISVEILLIIF